MFTHVRDPLQPLGLLGLHGRRLVVYDSVRVISSRNLALVSGVGDCAGVCNGFLTARKEGALWVWQPRTDRVNPGASLRVSRAGFVRESSLRGSPCKRLCQERSLHPLLHEWRSRSPVATAPRAMKGLPHPSLTRVNRRQLALGAVPPLRATAIASLTRRCEIP